MTSNILLIPGTSQVAHLCEHMVAAQLDRPDNALGELDAIVVACAH